MKILRVPARTTPNVRKMILINKWMDKTFGERPKFIIEKIRKIEDIYEKYTLLLTFEQIKYVNFNF